MNLPDSMTKPDGSPDWNYLAYHTFRLLMAMVIGTLTLMATADNPWDGDEFIKGPFAGITIYGNNALIAIFRHKKE